MKKWYTFGILSGALTAILTVLLVFGTGSSRYAGFIILCFPFAPLLFSNAERERIRNSRIFRGFSIEIAVVLFLFCCAIIDEGNDIWWIYNEFGKGGNLYRECIGTAISMFFVGVIDWYLVFAIYSSVKAGAEIFWNRSLIKKFFSFLKRKKDAYLYELTHADIGGELGPKIKRFVRINALIAGICASFWFLGYLGVFLYSIVLFKFISNFFSKTKSSYIKLYDIISQMAAGDIDVNLDEDLGVFESFKPNVAKIQEGIRTAVDKEVASERMRMELVSNVSHDLKTPLTAMITYIDLLKDEKLSEDKRKEYLEILSNRSERLKNLIDDLFEVTKATTGNIKFEPMHIDLVNLIKQVIFEYEYRFEQAGLEVIFEAPEKKTPIYVDNQKTYRVYANLFGNVAKYSMKNSRVYVQIEESDNEAMVVIRNMSANRISQKESELVERFVRGDRSRNTEGSGLGLAIAKSFTELQGGDFEIIVDGDLFKSITVWKKHSEQ